jgi:transposase
VVWAIEDCRHLSARLERDLMAGDQKVVRVPPKMMAQTRASARTPGKSDPIDALAVARAFLREPDLPIASHDEVSRELKLLVDRCEVLVAQRTSTYRLLWRVDELDPSRAPKPRSLDLAKHRRLLGDWLVNQPGLVAELARDELADIARLTEAIDALAKRIAERVRTVAPTLLAMPGCGELTAAKLVGEAAGVTRFKSEAAFARHSGLAPIAVWSGNTAGRVRHTRSGNRQLNAALHRRHPDPPRRTRAGLLPQEARRSLIHIRGVALPQTPPRSRRVPPPAHRPPKPTPALPTGSGLT